MIKVLLFGTFAKGAGCREIEIESKAAGQTLDDIVREVRQRFLKGEVGVYMTAVNEVQAKGDTKINDGDEVAIMPPFSGG